MINAQHWLQRTGVHWASWVIARLHYAEHEGSGWACVCPVCERFRDARAERMAADV